MRDPIVSHVYFVIFIELALRVFSIHENRSLFLIISSLPKLQEGTVTTKSSFLVAYNFCFREKFVVILEILILLLVS